MKKAEVQLEYISFFKDEVKLKFTFFDRAKKVNVGKFVYDYKNATDYVKLKDCYDDFIKTNGIEVVGDVNVVLSTNEVFNTSFILPKAASSKLAKFVENDLLDKFGVEYKKKYRTASIVSKYKDGGLCVCTSLVSNDLIRKISDILSNVNLKIKNVTSINFLLHEKRKLQKNEVNKIVLYVKDNYTAINVYYAGALVERTVSYHSYKYLTSMNIVQRRKLIRELVLSIVTLIGKIDFNDKDVEFTNVDLHVNDDVLASQFKYENPLGFTFNVIKKKEFDTELFKKYLFLTKPVINKGFTLVEVSVALAAFAICSVSLIYLATFLGTTNGNTATKALVYNAVENIATDVHNNPVAAGAYISWNHDQNVKQTLVYDSGFKLLDRSAEGFNEEDVYATLTYTAKTEDIVGNNKKYTVDIYSVNIPTQEESVISSLSITSVF